MTHAHHVVPCAAMASLVMLLAQPLHAADLFDIGLAAGGAPSR